MPLRKSGLLIRIHLQPSEKHFTIYTPSPIPFAYQTQFKQKLDSLEQQEIISLSVMSPVVGAIS